MFPILLFLLTVTISTTTLTTATPHHNRHLLHQAYFPLKTLPPLPSQTDQTPPTPSPHNHHRHHHAPSTSPQPAASTTTPKYPFSVTATPPPTSTEKPFFPFLPSPPSPPPPSSTTGTPTFPANISSIIFPHQPSSLSHGHVVAISVSVSFLFAAVIIAVTALLVYSRHNSIPTTTTTAAPPISKTDDSSSRLFPPNTAPSDKPPVFTSPHASSEFLYLGTLVNSRGEIEQQQQQQQNNCPESTSYSQPKPGSASPELKPLPPLPRINYNVYTSGESQVRIINPNGECVEAREGNDNDDVEEFFSPRGSLGRRECSPKRFESSSSRREFNGCEPFGSRSFNSRTASYPYSNTCSPLSDFVPRSMHSPINITKNNNFVVNFLEPPVMVNRSHSSISSSSASMDTSNSPNRTSVSSLHTKQCIENESNNGFVVEKLPPVAPPPPPPGFFQTPVVNTGPPVLVTPSRPILSLNLVKEQPSVEREDDDTPAKPKLKPLHWDKVRASSDRVMVWDQLKSSSFQVNEEMIETLFMVNNKNNSNLNSKDDTRFQILPIQSQENRVLDPKKSQNIAILLRALNRVDAMLYIANFDSEVDYLRRSFEILQSACEELRNSRMFQKLLEAVLKTGNRMNVGTNRGDAHAFKLDTLLKLVDVKGTDGKTSLLHFVVQEIIKAEGSRISTEGQKPTIEKTQQSTYHDDVEYRKLGLQVVSGLSGELTNVKKSAAMDSDVLRNDLARLAAGISKVTEVVKLNEPLDSSQKFRESINGFLKKAEEDIVKIQAQQKAAFLLVKEITEYFQDNSVKEEAHPFRIFMVVRDFLSILDQVCKEVGKMNERTIYGTVRPTPAMPTVVPLAFPMFNVRLQVGASDDESSSSS
ncbi:hypothetical protein ACFE04_005945 [Oxalis oulophora]